MTLLTNALGATLLIGMQVVAPTFNQYAVELYSGATRMPRGISLDDSGVWRDSAGKAVTRPGINFAGKYYVGTHSCGTACRFYSLTDLTTGADLTALDMFASTEPPPATQEGYPYVTYLEFRSDSRLLIAHYVIAGPIADLCRERAFLLKGTSVSAVAGTRNVSC